MSRLDEDREDLIRLIYSILDYSRLGYQISTCDNCNNCYRINCKYKPKPGQMVSWRCPLFVGINGEGSEDGEE